MAYSVTDLIKQRKSVRSYDGRPLSEEDRKSLEDYIASLENPFDVPVEFRLLDVKEYGLSSPVIVGENNYLAAKVKPAEHFEIAYGYSFEKVCLYALSLGIGTVILVASLSRAALEKAMELQDGEIMPAGSPVGYPAARRSIRETLMRKGLKADERLPFKELFFDGAYGKPLSREKAGDFAEALKMARLAPSAANKQPWRVIKDSERIHFYEAKTMKDSPLGDVQKVDLGIFLAHFDMTMEEKGYTGNFVFDDPGIAVPENVYYIVSYQMER